MILRHMVLHAKYQEYIYLSAFQFIRRQYENNNFKTDLISI